MTSKGSSGVKIIEDILDQPLAEKAMNESLTKEETAQIIATMLFEVTNKTNTKLIEVRDKSRIADVGTFKYSGQIDTMNAEGLMPQDVYDDLKDIGIDRHIGPCYLRVKGLLTHVPTRILFGKQMAYRIRDYLNDKPLSRKDGFIVSAPNMTGGAYIGDETGRQLQTVLASYPVWRATPYTRDIRKPIDAVKKMRNLLMVSKD